MNMSVNAKYFTHPHFFADLTTKARWYKIEVGEFFKTKAIKSRIETGAVSNLGSRFYGIKKDSEIVKTKWILVLLVIRFNLNKITVLLIMNTRRYITII